MSKNGWTAAVVAIALAASPGAAAWAQATGQAAPPASGTPPTTLAPGPAKPTEAFVPPIRRVVPKAVAPAPAGAAAGKARGALKVAPAKRCATGKVWNGADAKCVTRPLLKPSIPAKRKIRR